MLYSADVNWIYKRLEQENACHWYKKDAILRELLNSKQGIEGMFTKLDCARGQNYLIGGITDEKDVSWFESEKDVGWVSNNLGWGMV